MITMEDFRAWLRLCSEEQLEQFWEALNDEWEHREPPREETVHPPLGAGSFGPTWSKEALNHFKDNFVLEAMRKRYEQMAQQVELEKARNLTIGNCEKKNF